MFEFPEPPHQTAERARAALALIERHKARLNPRNYAIWYAYVSAAPPDIVDAVDTSLSQGTDYTEELGRGLWDRYFGMHALNATAGAVGEKLGKELDEVLSLLESAGTDTQAYGKALRAAASQLAAKGELGAVKDVIATLAAETQQMADRTRMLESKLEASAKEAEELRKTLETARRDALTDALTGIANRKSFDLKLREDAAQANDTGEPLSLLIADIDFFKKFNDTHGHQIGDQVLRLVARTLSETLKGRDTPSRYGGEEFAIILPATRLAQALTVAEKIRELVARRAIVRRDTRQALGGITLSLGVACFRIGEPLGELIQRADEALYRAKRNGRNRVETESRSVAAMGAAE